MNKYVVIVAGGSGLRMGTEVPKQFLLLKNKPVLMHTIQQFANVYNDIKIILILPNNQKDYWVLLCNTYNFNLPHTIVDGGNTRFGSVKNGLNAIFETTECIVAVHDGVRPLVSSTTIANCFETATILGNAVPCISINDSMRMIENSKSTHVNRNHYKAVQTPQVFLGSIIKKAYSQTYSDIFTDDASVVEMDGVNINLVEGNIENIKITTPFDLMIAESLLNR